MPPPVPSDPPIPMLLPDPLPLPDPKPPESVVVSATGVVDGAEVVLTSGALVVTVVMIGLGVGGVINMVSGVVDVEEVVAVVCEEVGVDEETKGENVFLMVEVEEIGESEIGVEVEVDGIGEAEVGVEVEVEETGGSEVGVIAELGAEKLVGGEELG